ncbi:ATP-dependent zinc metalloprotease FtsH [Mangrovicoccus sp. HB161399]|uniref:ATP-dependent zinc metalloprotease FtsH n=1 Tax=Mangrovicoccus sp. HB161399 TaxID=2720392 RepID=UPI0020A6AB6F|nr:ATP-dependent zinc metalloprotease FtsH [Mangrovicoccus sp. HB161399]
MPNDPQMPRDRPPAEPDPWVRMGAILLAVAFTLALAFAAGQSSAPVETVSYSAAKQMIRSGEVSSAVLADQAVTLTAPGESGSETRFRAVAPAQGDPELLPLLEQHGIEITAQEPSGGSALVFLLPWMLILGFYFWMQRRMMGQFGGGLGAGGPGGLWKGRFSAPAQTSPGTTFGDVAGQEQAKREVAELVEFLREPERFRAVGAEVPHGVLLMGPPGTGKTLMAKALAGEAGVPFFSTSGSEFIEVFVGVGAGRVRKMFAAARKAAPAVIFIDELDSIGRTRGTGLGGGHDEREQTLNQILAELDGFEGKEAVVVLAATNRPDVLDPALLRPGRFDRHVTLNLPDRAGRLAILRLHAGDLPLEDAAGIEAIAAGTPGFSGADLKNLLNEAAINAARRRAQTISSADLQEARDKVMMGTERNLAIGTEERHRLAAHEAGHAAAAFYSPGADPLYKVTIIPRGQALGGTHMLEGEEHHTMPEEYLRAQLAILLAGRAAERKLAGSASSGAEDDIRRATAIARSMVTRWGMAEELGPVDLRSSEDSPFLGQSIAQPREHSDETAARADAAVIRMLKEAEEAAEAIIAAHEDGIRLLVRELERQETLDADQVAALLGQPGKVRHMPPRPDAGRGRDPGK